MRKFRSGKKFTIKRKKIEKMQMFQNAPIPLSFNLLKIFERKCENHMWNNRLTISVILDKKFQDIFCKKRVDVSIGKIWLMISTIFHLKSIFENTIFHGWTKIKSFSFLLKVKSWKPENSDLNKMVTRGGHIRKFKIKYKIPFYRPSADLGLIFSQNSILNIISSFIGFWPI